MGLQFGVFDHIEPVKDAPLQNVYQSRLDQIQKLDKAGFYCYHLAEHHTPAVHSLAPSQNVFLSAASQVTSNIKLAPCVYVLPLHHPLRLIEEISMLDTLSKGRMEIGVGRGGVMEAFFWGQEADSESNYQRYVETLEIMRRGLTNEYLNFQGDFYDFDELPMRMHSLQKPYPPLWYMRNAETAAMEGMNTMVVGSLDSIHKEAEKYKEKWEEYQGKGTKTLQGEDPKIGLVVHMTLAETDEEAIKIAQPAWEQYRWNLEAPRRMEAEKRNLDQFKSSNPNQFGFVGERPQNAPDRELRKDISAELEKFDDGKKVQNPGRLGGVAMAGSPASMMEYMDEYIESGANYFVCSFQWGSISNEEAEQSIELFTNEVMSKYL